MEKNNITKWHKGLLTVLALFTLSIAQGDGLKYYAVFLKGKVNTAALLQTPEKYLGPKAIERRQRLNIPIKINDLPVNNGYVDSLENIGAQVIYKSKWMNALLVATTEAVVAQIKQKPYCKSVSLMSDKTNQNLGQAEAMQVTPDSVLPNYAPYSPTLQPSDYGQSWHQNLMLGTNQMHDSSIAGQGVLIAVLDAGFKNVNTHTSTKHLITQNQIRATYDFVEGENQVYDDHQHGAYVLSCIGGYWPSKLIGTAYKASFLLFKTEHVSTEYPVELFYWIVAAEKADSLGADVITTSLGYSTFDNPNLNFSYQNLDGNQAIMTQAADIAASKGILVVTSAGNYGSSDWKYITVPADADSVLAVGGVHSDSTLSASSSRGPTVDGRIKPDVMARGTSVVFMHGFNNNLVSAGTGTSYAAPLVAGLAAGLIQANRQTHPVAIMDAMRLTGSHSLAPNNDFGFGLPNYNRCNQALNKGGNNINRTANFLLKPSITETNNNITADVPIDFIGQACDVFIFGQTGKKIAQQNYNALPSSFQISVAGLEKGIYILNVAFKNGTVVNQRFAVQ